MIAPGWQAVFEEGITNIVLDLSEIGLLSSIGIREIMAVYKDCAAKGGNLVLCLWSKVDEAWRYIKNLQNGVFMVVVTALSLLVPASQQRVPSGRLPQPP